MKVHESQIYQAVKVEGLSFPTKNQPVVGDGDLLYQMLNGTGILTYVHLPPKITQFCR